MMLKRRYPDAPPVPPAVAPSGGSGFAASTRRDAKASSWRGLGDESIQPPDAVADADGPKPTPSAVEAAAPVPAREEDAVAAVPTGLPTATAVADSCMGSARTGVPGVCAPDAPPLEMCAPCCGAPTAFAAVAAAAVAVTTAVAVAPPLKSPPLSAGPVGEPSGPFSDVCETTVGVTPTSTPADTSGGVVGSGVAAGRGDDAEPGAAVCGCGC